MEVSKNDRTDMDSNYMVGVINDLVNRNYKLGNGII